MTRKLDRLNASNSQGLAFQRLWQKNCETAEGNFDDLQTQQSDLATVVSNLAAAVADIVTAQAAADAAQSTANTVKRDDKITASWTVPADVVTATDTGSDVTITVAAHTRLYGDGSQVSVSSHSFTGKAYGTDYGIYYDDTTASDTTPSYQITTTLSRAQNSYAAGRHRVAIVTTPTAGNPPTSGGSSPTGGGKDDIDKYSTL